MVGTWPSPIRGRVVITPQILHGEPYALDAFGSHLWWPISPRARCRVELRDPRLSFEGNAYFDANAGDAPLEADFSRWSWCRSTTPSGAAITYDVTRRDGTSRLVGMEFGPDGSVEQGGDFERVSLAPGGWGVSRELRAPAGSDAKLIETLEDTPFYNRSKLSLRQRGEPQVAVHEALDLDRFRKAWVRALLPMRMGRVWA